MQWFYFCVTLAKLNDKVQCDVTRWKTISNVKVFIVGVFLYTSDLINWEKEIIIPSIFFRIKAF